MLRKVETIMKEDLIKTKRLCPEFQVLLAQLEVGDRLIISFAQNNKEALEIIQESFQQNVSIFLNIGLMDNTKQRVSVKWTFTSFEFIIKLKGSCFKCYRSFI